MKHFSRISSLSMIVFIISLFITIPALAIPPLPSSFYGTVKVNNANVPDGTVIQAVIGGQVYAEGFTQTYQGNSVYALDVQAITPIQRPRMGRGRAILSSSRSEACWPIRQLYGIPVRMSI